MSARLSRRMFQVVALALLGGVIALFVGILSGGHQPYAALRDSWLGGEDHSTLLAAVLTLLVLVLGWAVLVLLLRTISDAPPMAFTPDHLQRLRRDLHESHHGPAHRERQRWARTVGLAGGGGVGGALVLVWLEDWLDPPQLQLAALGTALLFGSLAGIAHGRSLRGRVAYALSFAVLAAGTLPTTHLYLQLRPDPFLFELLLPVAVGGLPGGLLAALCHRRVDTRSSPCSQD